MLEFYVESDFKRRNLRQSPLGEYLNGFAGWLRSAGYKRRPAQLTLRGASHLGYWALAHGVASEQFDNDVLDAFQVIFPPARVHTPSTVVTITTRPGRGALSSIYEGYASYR